MLFKRIAAVVIWLLVTLIFACGASAFGFLASELRIAPSDFFSRASIAPGPNLSELAIYVAKTAG